MAFNLDVLVALMKGEFFVKATTPRQACYLWVVQDVVRGTCDVAYDDSVMVC